MTYFAMLDAILLTDSPTCKNSQPVPIRAARGETVEIDCDLEANPQVCIK